MASRITTPIFLYLFAALLPPRSTENDIDYYGALDLTQRASADDIKKAFKKKSLRLHPDKVLQRGGDVAESQAEYEIVQQAYNVLNDPKKRSKYHQYGKSSSLYEFMEESGSLYNPSNMVTNLSNSTCAQKTRLVILGALLVPVLLILPILICIKVNHLDDGGALESTDWIVLLTPLWVLQGIYIIGLLGAFILTEFYWLVGVQFIEGVVLYAAEVLIVLEWDEIIDWPYWQVFIPIYVFLLMRLVRRLVTIFKIRYDIQRMVSLEFVEQELGRPYEDLAEDEREEIGKSFLIVQVPPDLDLEEDDDEVQYSPEYEAAMDHYNVNLAAVMNLVFFAMPQMLMIMLQLENIVDVTWWLIFVPSWVYTFVQMGWNMYKCFCGQAVDGEVVLEGGAPSSDGFTEMDRQQHSNNFVDPNASMSKFNVPSDRTDEFGNSNAPIILTDGDPDAATQVLPPTPSVDSSTLPMSPDAPLFQAISPTLSNSSKTSSVDDFPGHDPQGGKTASATTLSAETERDATNGEQQPNPETKPSAFPTFRESNDASKTNTVNNPNGSSPTEVGSSSSINAPSEAALGTESISPDEKENEGDPALLVAGVAMQAAKEHILTGDMEQSSNVQQNPVDNDVVMEEEEEMYVDDEAFRQWQSAYQEAESNAMEAQARAQANCCVVLFQLTVLLLVVGKLDGAKYNALWILTPVLLVGFCTFCCCACIVYGAGAIGLESWMDGDEPEDTDDDATGIMRQNIISQPDTETEGLLRRTVEDDPQGRDGLMRDGEMRENEGLMREEDGLMKPLVDEEPYTYDDGLD